MTLDEIANDPRFKPYWGWHDDHRAHDRTPQYAPAVQQNRAEFHAFIEMLIMGGFGAGSCIQLGLGPTGASHVMFQSVFTKVWSVDRAFALVPTMTVIGDTHSMEVFERIKGFEAEFDLLFIDAGHKYEDVHDDFYRYKGLVRPGGIIALHDACKRPTYEDEIEVWRFVEHLRAVGRSVHVIGDEIGIAWMVKE